MKTEELPGAGTSCNVETGKTLVEARRGFLIAKPNHIASIQDQF